MRALLLAFSLLCLMQDARADKLDIVASFSILGDMTKQVAGEHADIHVLVGANGDAHVYEPTPADAEAISKADLVIVNGLGFEGWMERLIASSGYKKTVVVATRDIAPLSFSGEGLTQDPHAWQSLSNAKIYITNIRDALMAADPAHSADYKNNAAHYAQEIDALDRWTKERIATLPAEKRKVITTHDAFQYFGHGYGVTFIAPLGISTESEPSAGDIARLIDQMRGEHIRALFLENISDTRTIKQLEADGAAHIGGTLYSDALSPPDGQAPSYLAMFRHNVGELVEGMAWNGAGK